MPKKIPNKTDLLGLGKIIETVARIVPQTMGQIGKIVKTVSDNKLKLKLEVIKNNLEILNVKVLLAQASLKNGLKISEDLVKDIFNTCDFLIKINYEILSIIGSGTKEENSRRNNKRIDDLIDYMKEHPETYLSPFFPYAPLAVALYKKLSKG